LIGEARAAGIQWALAPVADVNSNPNNPVINVRSFGEDPRLVSEAVAAFIRGAHQSRLLVMAKHFPGNGDTSIDSHRALASIDSSLAHLQEIELPPFRAAISEGVDAILLARARVPALEPDPRKITTISSYIINGVLKDELGFKGLVVTDALEMRGITELYGSTKDSPTSRAAVDAVKAGCDVIMIPTDLDGDFHAIVDAVKNGQISETRIDDSVRKILEMKAAVGLDKNRFVDLELARGATSTSDAAFGQEIANRAVTLVRDNGKLLPLRSREDILGLPDSGLKTKMIVVVLAEALEEQNGNQFEQEIRARQPEASIFCFDGRFPGAIASQILASGSDANQIVLGTYVVHGAAKHITTGGRNLSYFGLQGLSGQLFQEIISKYREKTIVIALGNPYLIESFPQIQNYLCTYAMATTSEVSAVKAILGEIQNHAKLPIMLPGVAVRGFSLSWPSKHPQDVSGRTRFQTSKAGWPTS
jgi:beta-N-acetylhexosaminidase